MVPFCLFTTLTPVVASLSAVLMSVLSIRHHKEKYFSQESELPQGSILGPLFFAIMLNDIANKVNVNVWYFADDHKSFAEINCVIDAITLQHTLSVI